MTRRLLSFVFPAGIVLFAVIGEMTGYAPAVMKPLTTGLTAALAGAWLWLARLDGASPIQKGMTVCLAVYLAGTWLWPAWPGRVVVRFPVALLYLVLFLTAVLPPLLGGRPFTMFFARRSTPKEFWETDIFLTINRRLTLFWAALFLTSGLSCLAPWFLGREGRLGYFLIFSLAVPAALQLGLGVKANRWYPRHYQRRLGLVP